MDAEIWYEDSKAIVDLEGSWLTNLSDENGDVLFPRRTLIAPDGSKKIRGGNHVCVPNFGPGGKSGLAQHGFGRSSVWEVTDKTDQSLLLTLKEGEGEYRDVTSLMTHQMAEKMLLSTLEVTNNGPKDVAVAPGFHPYLMIGEDETSITVDGKKYELDELLEVIFITGNEHVVKTASATFTMKSDEMAVWGIWTDQLGPYICIEPTLNGFAFENGTAEMLPPGKSRQYGFSMSWER